MNATLPNEVSANPDTIRVFSKDIKKRLIDLGATNVDAITITQGVSSYLQSLFNRLSTSNLSDPILFLGDFDLKFLLTFLSNDAFTKKYLLVFNDLKSNDVIKSKTALDADRTIRDVTDLGDNKNGLYMFSVLFRTHIKDAAVPRVDSYLIHTNNDVFESDYFKTSKDSSLFVKAKVNDRSDDRKSYTDSIFSSNRKMIPSKISPVIPSSYKLIPGTINSVPFMNGTPGTSKAHSKAHKYTLPSSTNGASSHLRTKTSVDSLIRDNDMKMSKYPILNFLLDSSRAERN